MSSSVDIIFVSSSLLFKRNPSLGNGENHSNLASYPESIDSCPWEKVKIIMRNLGQYSVPTKNTTRIN